jgi:predicted P-loop ATPase/phage/plasmid primase-like uncharacterized protein
MIGASLNTARRALGFVAPDDRDTWVRMGMALKAEFGDAAYDVWEAWSSTAKSFDIKACKASWKSFKGGKVGIGTLFSEAKTNGFAFEDDELEVSPAELAKRQRERDERDAEAEVKRLARAQAACKRAASQWRMASDDGTSPYLERKQVRPESCRFLQNGTLLVPMLRYDCVPVHLVGKQEIKPDGEKRYSGGMDKFAAMCRLGKPAADGDDIYVAEGYATGGSVRAAFGHQVPVYLCFDTSGLLSGARVIRALYPNSRIIFCADDDYLTGNKGRDKAQAAADDVGNAIVVLPRFSVPRRPKKTDESMPMLTDFNDLHLAESIEQVSIQILAATSRKVSVPAGDPASSPRDSAAPAQAVNGGKAVSTPRGAGAAHVVLPGDDADDYAWQSELILKPSNNRLEDCRENVFTILTNDRKLKGVVALDEFSMMIVKRGVAPWVSTPGEWTEEDDFSLGMYMAQRHRLVIKSDGAIEKAVAQAARANKFNPVTEYLSALVWDGESRLGTWLHKVAGVEQSPYYELIGTLFLMSMVARAYQPGCKMDYAPVFEGGQGAGKSSLLRALGGEWYKDTPFKVGEKDGYLSIQGAWLYEIAELDSFNRGDITTIKAFISNQIDDFRAPYGRRNVKYPRRTCFAATTNQDEYLKDPSGARRFWPVRCGAIDLDMLAAIRNQLFAEALILVDAGIKWHPTTEQQATLIKPEQDEREIDEPWYPRIYRFVEGIAESSDRAPLPRLREVTTEMLLTKALQIEIGKISSARGETTRVGNCMKRMGWTRKRRSDGAREYYYVRPDNQTGGQDDETTN